MYYWRRPWRWTGLLNELVYFTIELELYLYVCEKIFKGQVLCFNSWNCVNLCSAINYKSLQITFTIISKTQSYYHTCSFIHGTNVSQISSMVKIHDTFFKIASESFYKTLEVVGNFAILFSRMSPKFENFVTILSCE